MFQAFLRRGLCVIPLRKGVPQVEWSRYYDAMPTMDEAKAWEDAGHKEYAVLCGKQSGVIALDIDTNDTAIYYMLAGSTPLRKVGSKGFTAFYRYNGERSQNWGGVVELLSDKRLTTIPPSAHRKTGIPYVWMDGDSWDDLPVIGADFFTFMDSKYPKQTRTWAPIVDYSDRVDLRDAAEMLEYINSDCPRDEWVQVGMALRDEFGDAACAIWHSWSAKAATRYNHNDAQSAWRSFGGVGVTIGTLVYLAKQGGWQPESKAPEAFEVDLSYIFVAKQQETVGAQKVCAEPLKVGGLVGEIADWITETAIRPQPVLSLAAAISFVGLLKGHRVRGRTNLRTNMLIMSLAPTSGGKEHPQQSIDRLAEVCGIGKNLMGRPTSGTGLLTGIAKCGGVALLSIDELGRFMGNISLKTSGGFQREITDYMVELFSAAGRTFRGRQYANEKQNPQVILQQPHFCVLGSTVPERLQAAFTGTEIIDGFLNRWLVFSATERPEKQKGLKFAPPPAVLVDKVTAWMNNYPLLRDNYGTPEPMEMTFTPEAYERLKEFEGEMMGKLDSEPYPVNELYARAPEHAEKLAMILCDDSAIGMAEIETAIRIVEQSNLQMATFASKITDTDHEGRLNYVYDAIKRAGRITREQLTYKTRKLSNRERKEIVEQLIESGEVQAEVEGKKLTLSIPS